MKKHSLLIFSILLTVFISCNDDNPISDDDKFPEVKNLSEFEKTIFVPTLEHQITNDKNAVYCVTLLYAWEEVRKIINQPLEISNEYPDLQLLNQSMSFDNVLKSNEYSASGTVDGDIIKTKAEFNKSLPFEVKLQSYQNNLVFDGHHVASFGLNGHDDYELRKIVKIVYYKNDNNFIIKLLPKDKKHEIILFKSEKTFGTLSEMYKEMESLTKIGETEKNNKNISWKYSIENEDKVVIPKFKFNIETNYTNLEGNFFNSSSKTFQITKAWQRTAFILDESGAEIESEAEMEAAEGDAGEEDQPNPKKMILDKPFLTLLKRTDASNPYFALWTTNAELMVEE